MTNYPFNIAEHPSWILWVAQDLSGVWWGYEAEPNQGAVAWYENEVGRYVRLGEGPENRDWVETLRKIDYL